MAHYWWPSFLKALIAANEVNNSSKIAIALIKDDQMWSTVTILTHNLPSKEVLKELLEDMILVMQEYFIRMQGEDFDPIKTMPQFPLYVGKMIIHIHHLPNAYNDKWYIIHICSSGLRSMGYPTKLGTEARDSRVEVPRYLRIYESFFRI